MSALGNCTGNSNGNVHRNLHSRWDTEVCLFCAESRKHLLEELTSWERYLNTAPENLSLPDVAFSLARAYESSGQCLAVVASSIPELARKVAHAKERCGMPECNRIQDRSGIFWFEEPLGPTGKIAFMFPGEGAQYVGMLRDLCIHFPEARESFDTVDRACEEAGADFVPSALIFPVDGSGEDSANHALWTMEAAVESVISADLACMQVFTGLAVEPDGVVGHSSGEFAALVQAEIVRFDSDRERIASIADGYRLVQELVSRNDISEAVLLTVGGTDSVVIHNTLAAHPGQLLVAMANCPHQFVLCAVPDIAAEVRDSLTQQGAVVSQLPFDRPYHTPWFEPALEGISAHFRKYQMHPSNVELYSCATADICPNDVEKIRELGIVQWANTVRFQETIERMYSRGYRTFIEVGPRGNLAAFVTDILKGRPHLSVATNRTHRPAITQLNHAVGLLAAHRVHMDPLYLYARRTVAAVGPKISPAPASTSKTSSLSFSPTLPQIRLDIATDRRPSSTRSSLPSTSNNAHVASPTQPPEGAASSQSVLTPAPPQQARAAALPDISAYFDTMQTFLSVQQEVACKLLSNRRPAVALAPRDLPTDTLEKSPIRSSFPFLGDVLERQPEGSLIAYKTFRVSEETLLKDHTFGTGISVLDADLTGLPVMPLTMTLEVMAEAAAELFSGNVVIGFENVRATQWISFESGEHPLRIEARRMADPAQLRVHTRILDQTPLTERAIPRAPVAEADVLLAPDYPEYSPMRSLSLGDTGRTNWMKRDIYPDRLFHGPRFQCIRSVSQWGAQGLEGTVEVLPKVGLIRSTPNPEFCTDPVLLDGIGAMLGLWGAYETLTGAVFFPFRVDSIQMFGPLLPVGTELRVAVQLTDRTDISTTADIDAYDSLGRPYVSIRGWHDRAFDVRPALHRVSHRPVDRYFSDFPDLLLRGHHASQFPDLIYCEAPNFPAGFFESSHRIWLKVLIFVMLSSPEREHYNAMSGSQERKLQWLMGRAAAKDAARRYILHRDGRRLAAADITIRTDDSGKPYADVASGDMRSAVEVSISHSQRLAVAVAGDARLGTLGVDAEVHRDLTQDFLDSAFSREDRLTLTSLSDPTSPWALRLWCAKEAISKALGIGMRYDPRDMIVKHIKRDTGDVELELGGKWLRHLSNSQQPRISVYTTDAGDYVAAICRSN